MSNPNLRDVKVVHINNTVIVENKTVNGELQAARVAFRAGAAEFAQRVQDKIDRSDMAGLLELLSAAKTKSFYSELA